MTLNVMVFLSCVRVTMSDHVILVTLHAGVTPRPVTLLFLVSKDQQLQCLFSSQSSFFNPWFVAYIRIGCLTTDNVKQ